LAKPTAFNSPDRCLVEGYPELLEEPLHGRQAFSAMTPKRNRRLRTSMSKPCTPRLGSWH